MNKLTGDYMDTPPPTTACGFGNMTTHVDNDDVAINLWDTAGQEKFRALINIYFRSANLVVFVCDISDIESFESLEFWIRLAEDNYGGVGNSVPAGLLVVNKLDLPESTYIISDDEIQQIANRYGIDWIKVSALGEHNLPELLNKIAKVCLFHSQNPNYASISPKLTHEDNDTPQENRENEHKVVETIYLNNMDNIENDFQQRNEQVLLFKIHPYQKNKVCCNI